MASASRISVVSVISSVSAAGIEAAALERVADVVDQAVVVELAAETLTEMPSRGRRAAIAPPAGRPARAPSARSATISPLSSAIGMNASGAMTPRLGWRQRSSASTPIGRSERRSKVGW